MKSNRPIAIIVTHSTEVFGPPHALANYLTRQGIDFYFIDHPLDYARERRSRLEIWQGGQKVMERQFPNWLAAQAINYFKDFVLTGWILLRYCRLRPISYFFGCDSLGCLVGLWLRFLIRPKWLIAYNTDYSINRFASPLLNTAYRLADHYTTSRSDKVWCVTERIAKIRRQDRKAADIILVPNGVYLKAVRGGGSHQKGLIFTGNLIPEKGLDLIFEALAKVKGARLTIYGGGPARQSLERLAHALGLSQRLTFAKPISNQAILALLSDYTAGVAVYRSSESYVYYSDPLKVKEYLAAGLPVIITDVPEIAQRIKREKAGVVISDESELSRGLRQLLKESTAMRPAALALAKEYDWDTIFARAFKQSF